MEWHCRLKLWNFVVVLLILFGQLHLIYPVSSLSNINTFSDYLSGHLHSSSSKVRVVKREVPNEIPLPTDTSSSPELPLLKDLRATDEGDLITLQNVLNCEHITNGIVRQFSNTLYLLSANQLFRLDVLPDNNSLFPLATFEAFIELATDFSIQPWGPNTLIIAIAFRSHYIIHRVPLVEDDRNGRAAEEENAKSFNQKRQALQKIFITPAELRSIKMKLFTVKDDLYLLRAETNDQNSSSIIS